MKPLAFAIIICATIPWFSSCKKNIDMTLVQKTQFENANIQQIEVGDAWQVTIVADTTNSYVDVEYSAYLEDYVNINMEGTKLTIGFKSYIYTQAGSVFKATVHTSSLNSLKAYEASKLTCDGEFRPTQSPIEIALDEAASCNGLQLNGEHITISAKSASQLLDFNINSNNCVVSVNESSVCKGDFYTGSHFEAHLTDASQLITFGGSALYGELTLDSASLLNMAQTAVDEMSVTLSNASEATVNVSERLEGSIKEASTLYYLGHPQIEIECSEDSEVIPL